MNSPIHFSNAKISNHDIYSSLINNNCRKYLTTEFNVLSDLLLKFKRKIGKDQIQIRDTIRQFITKYYTEYYSNEHGS